LFDILLTYYFYLIATVKKIWYILGILMHVAKMKVANSKFKSIKEDSLNV